MADAGYQVCVDAGGIVKKKDLGNGKHKHICYHHGKAYHSDVKEALHEFDGLQKSFNNDRQGAIDRMKKEFDDSVGK